MIELPSQQHALEIANWLALRDAYDFYDMENMKK